MNVVYYSPVYKIENDDEDIMFIVIQVGGLFEYIVIFSNCPLSWSKKGYKQLGAAKAYANTDMFKHKTRLERARK